MRVLYSFIKALQIVSVVWGTDKEVRLITPEQDKNAQACTCTFTCCMFRHVHACILMSCKMPQLETEL